MRKVIIGMMMVFLLVGCTQKEASEWQETEEKAIEVGLAAEGITQSEVMSVEEYEGETFVFFNVNDGFGMANIVQSNKGYRWVRDGPIAEFEVEKDDPFATAGFDFETEKGTKGSVLYGKVFDSSIEQMLASGNREEKELKVFDDSGWFYMIHQEPFELIEVTPSKK